MDAPHLTVITSPRFDKVLETGREAYLSSNLGKARKAIARADRYASDLRIAIAAVSTALTRGDGTAKARIALMDQLLDLRLACAEVEALVRLVDAEASDGPEAA